MEIPSELPIDCKFIWGSRDFDIELHRMKDRLRKDYGINVPVTIITHHMADDMRNGKIMVSPHIVKKKNQRFLIMEGDLHFKINKA